MMHVLFEQLRRNAQENLDQVEAQMDDTRDRMRDAFLAVRIGESQTLHRELQRLESDHKLALSRLEAVESTGKTAEEESLQTEANLNRLLSILPADQKKITTRMGQALEQLEAAAEEMSRSVQALEVANSQRYEARYLARCLGRETETIDLIRPDLARLPELAHRLTSLAQQAGSPNLALRWQAKFTELDRIVQRERKRQRRIAADKQAAAANPENVIALSPRKKQGGKKETQAKSV